MSTFIMAHQALFDALAAGMDTQATALAVQSLLDQQPVQESSNSAPAEEEDVFQCGKCKKQFTSLPHFMSHKREHCAPPQNSVSRPHAVTLGPSNNSAFTSTLAPSSLGRNVSFGTVPQSPSLSQVSSNVLGSDEVLISPFSGVEQNLPLQHSGVLQPSGPFLSSQLPPTSRSHGHGHGHQHPHHHHQQLQHHQQHQHQHHQQQSYGPSSSSSSTNHTATTITTLHPVSAPTIQSPPPPPVTASKRQSHSSIPVATVSITESTLSQVTQEILGVGGSRTSPTRQVGQLRALHTSGGQHGGGRRRKDPTSPKKPGKLKCTYCERTFHKNFDLQQHVRSHTGEKPFQCIVCGRAFAQKSNVKKHMSTHKVWPAGNQPTLPDKYILTKVVDGAEGSEGANGSTEAEKSDATPAQPQAEVSGHDDHDRKKDTDKDTMEYQTYKENQKQDGAADDGEKDEDGKIHSYIDSSYCCPYCPQRFKIYFQLKTHMTLHKDEQVYKCIMKDCAQTFKDLDSYLEHTKAHESEMVYRCHLCTKQFPSLYELGVHQYSHSLYPSQGGHQKQKKFRCTECKSKYKSEEALAHHVATTTHNFPCSKCKRVFPCERFLRRHLPSHSTEGDYQCTICSKKFKSDQYLKSHYLMHSGENPFKCATCGKAFNRKDKLKRHALIHDPVKKHKCPFKSLTGCTKAFHRADKLKAHIVSHSGIKPFKCNECNKCFSRKPNLAEHMRAHRDDYDLRCEICHKGFQRKKHLDAHKCRAHKADDDDDDTVEISLVDGAVRRPRRASKRKAKKSKPLIVEDEGEDGDTNPVVKTKTRQVKMKHSGFGKQKKMKKKRKREFKRIIVKREESPDPDIAEIQKDLEIIRSGMQKQKEEQERLDRERASGDLEPGREKITGSTDPMPIQGTDQADNTDHIDQANHMDQAEPADQGADATDASDGQFVNLGSEDVSGNDDTTAMALLNMSQEDGGHAMETSA